MAPMLSFGEYNLLAIKFYLLGLVVGALFPDIDEPASFIGRRTILLSHAISMFTKHRGATHTVGALLLYTLLGVAAVSAYGGTTELIFALLGFVLGNAVHISGDMMTNTGVRIFLPFSDKKRKLLPEQIIFKTGGPVEHLVVLPLFTLALCIEAYAVVQTLGLQ